MNRIAKFMVGRTGKIRNVVLAGWGVAGVFCLIINSWLIVNYGLAAAVVIDVGIAFIIFAFMRAKKNDKDSGQTRR